MFKIILSILTLVSLCLLVVMLNLTTPATAGPFGILSIFFFAYIMSLGFVTFFLFLTSRLMSYVSNILAYKKRIEPLNFKSSYYYSTVIAAAPILLSLIHI